MTPLSLYRVLGGCGCGCAALDSLYVHYGAYWDRACLLRCRQWVQAVCMCGYVLRFFIIWLQIKLVYLLGGGGKRSLSMGAAYRGGVRFSEPQVRDVICGVQAAWSDPSWAETEACVHVLLPRIYLCLRMESKTGTEFFSSSSSAWLLNESQAGIRADGDQTADVGGR